MESAAAAAVGVDSTEGGNYFNNIAVAARAAQAAGARRVMIIDWWVFVSGCKIYYCHVSSVIPQTIGAC